MTKGYNQIKYSQRILKELNSFIRFEIADKRLVLMSIKRIDLNANHKEEEDAELKDYIYSEVPWKYDYRRFDNKPIVFVIKSVVK